MPASDDLQDGLGEAFDTLSDEFLSGVTVKLCRADATSDAFEDLLTVSSKRFFEYSNFRKNFLLEIADDAGALTTAMTSATHVKINSDYYAIRQEDTTPPQSTDATWKVYVDKIDRPQNFVTV